MNDSDRDQEESSVPVRPSGNHWDIYSSMPGWEAVSARLDTALSESIRALDEAVAKGGSPRAVQDAFNSVQAVMDDPANAGFGAGDTEPRQYLADSLARHVRTRYGIDDAQVDRWGGTNLEVSAQTSLPPPKQEETGQPKANVWELYSSMEGWEVVADRLDAAVAAAAADLDRAVTEGATVPEAGQDAFAGVMKVMAMPENADFGACDSEPLGHLGRALTIHIRKRYDVPDDARINRYGDAEGFSEIGYRS